MGDYNLNPYTAYPAYPADYPQLAYADKNGPSNTPPIFAAAATQSYRNSQTSDKKQNELKKALLMKLLLLLLMMQQGSKAGPKDRSTLSRGGGQAANKPIGDGQGLNYDVRNDSGVTGEELNGKLKGALAGKGDVIAQQARANGMDPSFLASILMQESANGNSSAARNE